MRTLYIDTSSSYLYAAILIDTGEIVEVKKSLGHDLSKMALTEISSLFEIAKTTPDKIDKIIVVNGPGSFTGIRVGLTIAKTYAWAKSVNITTISSLEAMALSSPFEADYYIPLIDARRGYVYAGIYNKDTISVLKEQYIKLDTLLLTTENLPGNYWFITNDEIDLPNKTEYNPNLKRIIETYKNKENMNPHELDANYLKLTEAEEKKND